MRGRTVAVLGLWAMMLAGRPALGQQRVNPVGINPGPNLGTGGVVPPFVPGYIPPYYGPFGPYAYGGYGVVSPGFTGAIPGYGGYGFGPFGYNPTDSPLGQQQQYALASSRYDLQTAQTAKAYAEANYFQQQAIATAMQNQDAQNVAPPVRETFNVRSGSSKARKRAAAPAPTIPLDKLMTPDGGVRWPEASPPNEARDAFDAKVKVLAQGFSEGKKPTVREVNEARDALYAYGTPALAQVRAKSPAAAAPVKDFLNGMDATLLSWAK